MKPQIVKNCPLSSTEAVGTFRLPWRSTAEAREGAGGPRRLRGGRAAAAPSPGGRRAAPGPRAPRDAHRLVNNLAFVLQLLGKFSEAPLMCCAAVTVAGGWCCILCWEKLGKNAGKQQPSTTAFSDHLRICHLCRSAMMHEQWTCQFYANHLKSSQITSCMDVPKHGHVKV